jgi:hypothetical protein
LPNLLMQNFIKKQKQWKRKNLHFFMLKDMSKVLEQEDC